MQGARRFVTLLIGLVFSCMCMALLPGMATMATGPSCVAPLLAKGTPVSSVIPATPAHDPSAGAAETIESPEPSPALVADTATASRIVAGIENFVACRNAGDYAAYAALLTPNRVLAEAGTTNPVDVVAGLEAFNLPITILALDDVRRHADGRYSAEFVHLFGPHLYYRSRLFVVEEGGFVKFDEEQFLPEEPTGDQSAVDVRLTDFAFDLSQEAIANAQSVVLRGHNNGRDPHEIVVVRLPAGVTVAQALSGEVPEEEIVFVGQTTIDPGQRDDLVLVNLEPGLYTLLCFLAEPDGTPHAAKGMIAQVAIEGRAAPTP